MKNFQKIAEGVNTLPLLHALQRQPELWAQRKFRQEFEATPHAEVEDIWLRYAQEAKDREGVASALDSVWYPPAKALPQYKPIVLALMHLTEAYSLERLLITKLAPGKRIYPHADNRGDYVHAGDIARYHVVLQGLPGCVFRCGEDEVQMRTGEVWWFNAYEEHQVLNASADDRVHMLVDLRTMPC